MKIKNKRVGKVYLVGAGAGAADFITLRGMKILLQADVVIYDYLADDKNLLGYASPHAKLISADEIGEGTGNFSDGFSKRQDLINETMVKEALAGKNVVRLKNGDPMVFGRAHEEIETLVKNKISFRVIPGVSAFLSAASLAGIPLTARGFSSSVTLVTGHEAPEKKNNKVDWRWLGHSRDTLAVYMGVENIRKIARTLIKYGRSADTPVISVSIENGYPPFIVNSTLGRISSDGEFVKKSFKSPAVFIIGDVVKLQKKSLFEKKVLFTGLSDERFFEEGDIYHHPMIKIIPSDDYSALDSAIKKIAAATFKAEKRNKNFYYDWLVFTSRFGVYYFMKRLFTAGLDVRILSGGIKIAAIGKSTSAMIGNYGLKPDLVPHKESSEGLIEEFSRRTNEVRGKRFLLPRSDIADKGLAEGLSRMGAIVDSVIAYKNVPTEFDERLKRSLDMFDEIVFTSPSCVRSFISKYGLPPKNMKVKTIGPVTQMEWSKYARTQK